MPHVMGPGPRRMVLNALSRSQMCILRGREGGREGGRKIKGEREEEGKTERGREGEEENLYLSSMR